MAKTAKKKSTITAILNAVATVPAFAAVYFRVGAVPLTAAGTPVDGMPPVDKILYCRKGWGKGIQVDVPCYGVTFVGGEEVVIIPEQHAAQVTLVSEDITDENTAPGLPD